MVSLLSRLINHMTVFQRGKFLRNIEQLPKRRFFFKSKKTDEECDSSEPCSFVTRLAMPKDYDNVIDFLCKTYFKDEPSLVNMGLNDITPTPAMVNITLEQVKDGMTIIAVNTSDCIIGAAVNVGTCPWDPKKMIEYAKCYEEEGPSRDLIEFFAYVSRKPDIWNRYCVLKVFECSILAVDSEYRGVGVARKLVEESWYLARDCSYRLFRIDCTSRFTAHIAQGFGFDKICTIPYCRYVKDGELVFKHIKEPHTEVEVYVDRVTFCKAYTLPYKSQKCR